MSEWMKNFVGFLLIISVASHLLPDKKYEPYLRLFTGFLMILLLIQPVLKLGGVESYLEEKMLQFLQEQERLEEEIYNQRETFLLEEEPVTISRIEDVKVEVMLDGQKVE